MKFWSDVPAPFLAWITAAAALEARYAKDYLIGKLFK